jgi:hypothetical protein
MLDRFLSPTDATRVPALTVVYAPSRTCSLGRYLWLEGKAVRLEAGLNFSRTGLKKQFRYFRRNHHRF